jgi:flagellar FliL protein
MSDAKAAAAAAPAAEPAKKSKKLLIIIIAAVVVLGGGAGAYFGFMRKPAGKEGEHAKEEHKEAVKLPAQFVDLEPPFVVNFEPGATARFLQIAVQIKTREPEMLEFLEHNKPVIRNDLLLLFGNKHLEEVSSKEGKEALRAGALEAVRKIAKDEGAKPEGVEDVLFTSFVMQ